MKFHILLMTSMLALAACGGSGDSDIGGGGGGGDTGGENPVPDDDTIDPGDLPVDGTEVCGGFLCSGDVTNITFDAGADPDDPSDDLLVLTNLPFDDDPLGAQFTYLRTITGEDPDGPGGPMEAVDYDVYTNADDSPIPGFNQYLAIYKEVRINDDDEEPALRLGVAAIEGYVPFGYTGAWYDVNDLTASIPTLGLVEYLGNYAGTITFQNNPSLATTSGIVTMQVDFTDSRLKGFITDRSIDGSDGLISPTPTATLNDLVLNDTVISDGSFEGTVNSYDEDGAVVETGTYQGFFGGSDAAVVGGLVQAVGVYDFDGAEDTDPNDEFTARDLGVFSADRVPFPD